MKFEGIYTPIITPYLDDYSIDWSSLDIIINHVIDEGVSGIIVAGTTGEYYAQTAEERVQIMQFVKRKVGQRVPVIIGTGAIRTEDSIFFAQQARDIGADALLVATPPYACPTMREIALHALAIDKEANLPIMLYNYPGRMSVMIGEEALDKLGQSKNICAIKESSGDINQLHVLARDYPQIQLSCGMDDQVLEFFAWGARSWVCAGSNFAMKEHISLYKACVIEGDFVKGRAIMNAMLPLMRVLEQGGKFIQAVKYGVTMNNISAGVVRRPLRGLNKDEKRELDVVIRTMKQTIQSIEEMQ